MVISTVIGMLFGALLGLRFMALIVPPAIFVAVAIAAVSGIVRGDGIVWLVLTMIAVAAALEVGYIAGCTLRVIVAAKRANTDDGVSLLTSDRAVEISSRGDSHCLEVINEEGIELSPNLGDRKDQAVAVRADR
jgi:hypothetical protein